MTLGASDTEAGSGAAALVDGVDVDAVAAAVLGCDGVDDLSSTPATSVASYLPGRQVAGARVGSNAVTVQVRSRWGVPIADVAHQVRQALAGIVVGRSVDLTIADIADPPSGDRLATEPEEIGDPIVWTTTSDAPGGVPSSGTTIPTGAETPTSL